VKGGWDMDDRVGFSSTKPASTCSSCRERAADLPGVDPDLARQCIVAANS